MLNNEYRKYFLLVTKYNLIYESMRLVLAEKCFYIEKNGVLEDCFYDIENRKIAGKDVIVFAEIAKDLEKLNDFCTSYYPVDYQLKITDRKKTREDFHQVLKGESFKQEVNRLNIKSSYSQEIVEKLEEYREYYAKEEEKIAYDLLRRKEDYTYRFIKPLLGQKIMQDIFSSTYQDAIDKWSKKLGKTSRAVTNLIDIYCNSFAKPEEIEHYLALKKQNSIERLGQEKMIKEYIAWLREPYHQEIGYDAYFRKEKDYSVKYLDGILNDLKNSHYASSRAVYQEYLELIHQIDQKMKS